MYWKTTRQLQEGERLRSWPHQYRQMGNRSMATILWQREPDQNGGIWMARNCQHGQLRSGGRALLAQPNTWPGESRHSDCIRPWWIQEENFLKRKLGYCHKIETDTGEPKTWIEFHYKSLKMELVSWTLHVRQVYIHIDVQGYVMGITGARYSLVGYGNGWRALKFTYSN